jgi:hypothetical protein
MKVIKHICFRYFIVPVEAHLFASESNYQSKLKWLTETFLTNLDLKTKREQEYAIRIIKKERNAIYGKISKKQLYHHHEKVPNDIMDVNIEDWPYVSFACDTREKVQILVLEYDSRIIQRIGIFAEILSELANINMFRYGHSVSFEPIVDEKTFWNIIESSDGVYSISFFLSSPNIFGSESAANEALAELRNTFHNNRVNVTLANDQGKLIVPREKVDTYREYADRGGGNWKVVIQRKNKKRKYLSTERAIKVTIEAEGKGNVDTLRKALHNFLEIL